MARVIVALDSNVIDLVRDACATSGHIVAMEATEPPPCFEPMPKQLEVEVLACYWLLAMAPTLRSMVYTFSDLVYREVAAACDGDSLLRIAFDVLVREEQQAAHRVPDASRRPSVKVIQLLGVRHADAIHLADVIGLRADYFLTNDRRLRNCSDVVERGWSVKLRRPSEFLIEAAKAGAPWHPGHGRASDE